MTIYESQLPSVNQAEYERSRIRICDEAYLRKTLADDLIALQQDKLEKVSSASYEQVPYVEEAIAFYEELL